VGVWATCVIAGFGCAALVVAALFAIGSGGYRPERYAGQPDPVRVGLIVFFISACVVLGLIGASGFASWRARSDGSSLAFSAFGLGLVVMSASVLAFFVWAPPTSAPLVVPISIRVALFAGMGLAAVGLAFEAVSNFLAAIHARDWGLVLRFVVAFILLGGLVAIGFLRRAS
jgi:hypothetical protein